MLAGRIQNSIRPLLLNWTKVGDLSPSHTDKTQVDSRKASNKRPPLQIVQEEDAETESTCG